MLGKNVVDEELKRGFGLSIKEIEPFLRAGGDAAGNRFVDRGTEEVSIAAVAGAVAAGPDHFRSASVEAQFCVNCGIGRHHCRGGSLDAHVSADCDIAIAAVAANAGDLIR
jgi:hypothetical protein